MSSHKWPTLYKKSTSGKLSVWMIGVSESTIIVDSGFLGMKMTRSEDTIKSGKNIGRKNETSRHDQAMLEAESKFLKQIDKGYTSDKDEAAGGSLTEGAYLPMLAQSYDKHSEKIVFPCYVQPKLDGLRATCVNGKFSSRMRKPFGAVAHLEREIERLGLKDYKLDGELYNHDLKDQFEEIVSAVKREKTDNPVTQKIQYHIYDINMPGDFSHRLEQLGKLKRQVGDLSTLIKFVATELVTDEEEMFDVYREFVKDGYEGAMARNIRGTYGIDKRSYDLQKIKSFDDDEFKIVGINEGRGSLAGHAATFTLEIPEGYDKWGYRTFKAKLRGTNITPFLKSCFTDSSLWEEKWLTVQFQGWTVDHLPRFPTGVRIREPE